MAKGCHSIINALHLKIHSLSLLYTAIEPPISLKETKYTKENTYTVSSSSDSDGNELTYTYIVHDGAQFGVECSSVATPEEEFVGEVTWYKKMISSSGLCV